MGSPRWARTRTEYRSQCAAGFRSIGESHLTVRRSFFRRAKAGTSVGPVRSNYWRRDLGVSTYGKRMSGMLSVAVAALALCAAQPAQAAVPVPSVGTEYT